MTELLLIVVLFIVLIGPKELPAVLRQLIKAYRVYQQWLGRLSAEVQAVISSIENSTHQSADTDVHTKTPDKLSPSSEPKSSKQPLHASTDPKLVQEDTA